MILKSKDIQQPTEEQIAEMKAWNPDGSRRKIVDNLRGQAIIYAGDSPACLIYILNTEDQSTDLCYYYYFEEYYVSSLGLTVPKDRWIYYSTNIEFNTYSEQLGSIYFDEIDADVYSESYFSTLGRTLEKNELFLSTQKTMALKTKGKYCDDDIKIAPLLQKKTTIDNGFITPDEGFSGLDALLVEVDRGIYPTGSKTLTKNKTAYYVREYEEAYVDVDPEDLDLCDTTICFNGTYTPPVDKNGFYSVTVNVQADVKPTLQEKTIDTNGEYYPDEGNDGFSKVTVNVQPPLKDIEIVENGTYYAGSGYDGFGKVSVNVPEPTAGDGKYLARCVDYDGRILKQQYLNTGDEFDISDFQSNERLFRREITGWPVDGSVIRNSDITISPVYAPQSGYSEFDITLNENTGKTVQLASFNYMGNVVWGDDTNETVNGGHTYSDYGDYTIRIPNLTRVEGYFFKQDQSTPNTFCKRAFLAETVTKIDDNAFRNCRSLTCITIPISVTDIGEYAFRGCHSLTSIAIPESVVAINECTFSNCYSLFSVALPNTLTTIGDGAFADCYALNSISLPDSLTNLYSLDAFDDACSMKRIYIPSTITTFKQLGVFYALIEYDFSAHTSVPTLTKGWASSFSKNPLCKIIVPDALYDEWIAADNWSTFANYIYKVSEVTE